MDSHALATQVKQLALECGFDAVGIAPPTLSKDEPARLAAWLKQGMQGSLAYLARNPESRYDVHSLLPECRSVIVTALSYNHASQHSRASTPPKVARYAQGEDYHTIMKEKLDIFVGRLETEFAPGMQWKATVDTSPLAEKAFAVAAGIGWRGKHSIILNRELGSWFVLGMLLVPLELTTDSPVDGACGSCTRCLDACPTTALVKPFVLDARKCISYLTTARKASPDAAQLDGWLYGCDACQQACPFNQEAKSSREPRFQPRHAVRNLTWDAVVLATEESWRESHDGTEIGRRKLDWLKGAVPEPFRPHTLE